MQRVYILLSHLLSKGIKVKKTFARRQGIFFYDPICQFLKYLPLHSWGHLIIQESKRSYPKCKQLEMKILLVSDVSDRVVACRTENTASGMWQVISI